MQSNVRLWYHTFTGEPQDINKKASFFPFTFVPCKRNAKVCGICDACSYKHLNIVSCVTDMIILLNKKYQGIRIGANMFNWVLFVCLFV